MDEDFLQISLRQQRRIDQILSSQNVPAESECSMENLKLLDSNNQIGLQKLSMRNNTPDIPDKLFKTPNSSDQLDFQNHDEQEQLRGSRNRIIEQLPIMEES